MKHTLSCYVVRVILLTLICFTFSMIANAQTQIKITYGTDIKFVDSEKTYNGNDQIIVELQGFTDVGRTFLAGYGAYTITNWKQTNVNSAGYGISLSLTDIGSALYTLENFTSYTAKSIKPFKIDIINLVNGTKFGSAFQAHYNTNNTRFSAVKGSLSNLDWFNAQIETQDHFYRKTDILISIDSIRDPLRYPHQTATKEEIIENYIAPNGDKLVYDSEKKRITFYDTFSFNKDPVNKPIANFSDSHSIIYVTYGTSEGNGSTPETPMTLSIILDYLKTPAYQEDIILKGTQFSRFRSVKSTYTDPYTIPKDVHFTGVGASFTDVEFSNSITLESGDGVLSNVLITKGSLTMGNGTSLDTVAIKHNSEKSPVKVSLDPGMKKINSCTFYSDYESSFFISTPTNIFTNCIFYILKIQEPDFLPPANNCINCASNSKSWLSKRNLHEPGRYTKKGIKNLILETSLSSSNDHYDIGNPFKGGVLIPVTTMGGPSIILNRGMGTPTPPSP